MATLSSGRGSAGGDNELATGDHMSREEFHRIYAATSDAFHAELIGGIVYVPSPLKRQHGIHHLLLGALFAAYAARTPGVEVGDNPTVLLGEDMGSGPGSPSRRRPAMGRRGRAPCAGSGPRSPGWSTRKPATPPASPSSSRSHGP